MKLIEANLEKIATLCRKYKVAKLWVFGSILTPRFSDSSDIDFSVSFDKRKIELEDYADNYFDFMESLEMLFCRKVDLVCDDSVENPFFRSELNNTKMLVYG